MSRKPRAVQVAVPAVLRATNYATIFPQSPAKIVEMNVSTGKLVAAGDILYRLSAPDLTFKLRSARDQQRSLEVLIERQAGSLENLDNITVLREQLAASLSTQAGLLSRIERLTLRAPFAGVIKDLALELRPGQWIKADQPLGTLVSMESAELRGYVTSEDVDRIAPGAHGRFLPDDPTRPTMDVIVTELSHVNSTSLDVPMLASTHGGPIAAQPAGRSGVLVPNTAVYRVTLHPLLPERVPSQVIPGTVLVEGDARSAIARLARATAAVFIRESGF